MDNDLSALTTFTLDTQSLREQAEAIDRLLHSRLHELATHASRLIRRLHVTDAAFDADDAVQDALLQVWLAAKEGSIPAIQTLEDLRRLIVPKLNQEVLDEREREHTAKRGGSLTRRSDADLEAIDPHAVSPQEQAQAEEAVEKWLRRLQERGPVLRAIATKKSDGFNCREIAAELGISQRSVEYGITRIKAILARPGTEFD